MASRPPTNAEIYAALPRRGYADAVDRVAFTASPLLAGFAVTFIGLTLSGNVAMRWPNGTLMLLTLAVLLLVLSVQLAFNARSKYLTWDDFSSRLRLLDELKEGQDLQRIDYVDSLKAHRPLVRWTALAYNFGVAAFLAAVTLALVPPEGQSVGIARAVAIGLAGIAAIGEVGWFMSGEISLRWRRRLRTQERLEAERAGQESSEPRTTSSE